MCNKIKELSNIITLLCEWDISSVILFRDFGIVCGCYQCFCVSQHLLWQNLVLLQGYVFSTSNSLFSFSFELIAFVSAKEYRYFSESHISGNTRIGKRQQNRTSKFFLDLYFSFIFLRKFIHPWPVYMCLFFLVNLIMRLFNQLYSFLHKTLKKLLLNRNWNIKIVQWMDYNIYSPNVCNIYTPNPRGTSILNFLVPSLTILPH